MALVLPTNLPEDVLALFSPSDDVNSTDDRMGMTPLLHVVWKKRKDMKGAVAAVESLLKAGADVHAVDSMGHTALHFVYENAEGLYAYSPQDSPLAKALLAAGANKEAVNLELETPVQLSAGYRLARFKERHANKDDPDINAIIDDRNGGTLLHVALFNNCNEIDVDVAKLLIHEGADLYMENTHGIKPLDIVDKMLALEIRSDGVGQTSEFITQIESVVGGVVPAMIARGADFDAGEMGAKVLRITINEFTGDSGENIFEDHIDPLMELIDIDWKFATSNGYMVLHDLITRDLVYLDYTNEDGIEDPMMFLVLTIRGLYSRSQCTLDLNAKTLEGMTPLHLAAKLGYSSVIDELCELGADVNMATPASGWTPLHVACKHNTKWQLETVQALIERGANVDAITQDCKSSALHLACRFGSPELVRCLLNATRDIVSKDLGGMTALHYALDQEALSVESYVHSFFFGLARQTKSADLIVPGGETKQTPLHVAAAKGYSNIVEWILNQAGVGEAVMEAVDIKGRTALHLAAAQGHTECVFLLLKQSPESSFGAKRRRI